jgi:transmembrane sensor
MSEFADAIAAAGGNVQVEWTPDRARRVERSLLRRKKRQTRARVAAGVLGAATLALCAAVVLSKQDSRSSALIARADPLAVPLAAGARAVRLDAASVVSLKSSAPALVVAELSRGGARFQVTHDPARQFRVEAGSVVIEDRGTQFTVERLDDGVRVAVEEGQVQVRWPGGAGVLSAGEQELFPPRTPAPDATDDDAAPARRPARRHAHHASNGSSWKALAEDGDYDAAYDVLQRPGTSVRDETAELLLAVDVARLSHHPADAVAPLKRILVHHHLDPRAPLAAFTLGRVLLEDLGSPREAASAFSEVRRLDPDGALAEDALAREVECWSRAGELQRARERASEYLTAYPDGRRARSVSRFGHVE